MLQDAGLGLLVDGGEGVVEDEDGAAAKERTCQCDARLLAAREAQATGTDARCGAVRQVVLIEADRLPDRAEIIRPVGAAELDVFGNRAGEQLRTVAAVADDADGGAVAIAELLTAEIDSTIVRALTEQGAAERRLAAGDGTRDADDFAGPCRKGEVAEYRHFCAGIGEGNVLHGQHISRKRLLWLSQRRAFLQLRTDALPGNLRLLDGIEELGRM